MILRLLQWIVKQEWLLRLFGFLFGPFNPFTAEFRHDPHQTFRQMREAHPFYYSRVFQAYVATRYEDVQAVLRSPSFTTDRRDTDIMMGIYHYAISLFFWMSMATVPCMYARTQAWRMSCRTCGCFASSPSKACATRRTPAWRRS